MLLWQRFAEKNQEEKSMIKTNAVAKADRFGVPSLEISTRIANEDNVRALQAAHYRLSARMREIELQFEAKASELRQAFLDESAKILNGAEDEEP
jgi:hypothetical protein